MAGYTPRFFLTLSIPFFGFVLWFLKKKSSSKSVASKAVQVEDSASLELLEKHFLKLDIMKLKSQENCEEHVSEESVNSAMQLKETQTPQTQNTNGTSKGKKKKSKVREKSRTCPADIANGNDRLHPQDNVNQLANGVETIDLNKNCSDDGELILRVINNGNSQTDTVNSPMNGDSKDDSKPQTDKLSTKPNGCTKECDIDIHPERNSDDKSDPSSSHESLMLPLDCTEPQEMLESPGATYCDSVASGDSGRGGSDIHFEPPPEGYVLNYEFEIPQEYVGRLIGKKGVTVNAIKKATKAIVYIKDHPTSNHNKVCLLTGTEEQINAALRHIRKKFPPEHFPSVTLSQICFLPFMPCPDNLMLKLPEGARFDVILCSTVNAGHFFLQQPTHPTFHSLPLLTYNMAETYNGDVTVPLLPHMEKGYICAANIGDMWYRAEIEEVFYETDECRVRFLDYGGYCVVSRSALRQIHGGFMNVPFQATECYLGVLPPEGQTEWSSAATECFEQLACGQILSGFIMAYAEDCIPYVRLYRPNGEAMIDINQELILKGHARPLPNFPPSV